MNDDLVRRLRRFSYHDKISTTPWEAVKLIDAAADRIEELERHVELRDFFLVENDLWKKFAKGAEGKMK